ncbi:SdiA-regulated domain-containing protein [Halopseudomonas sp.]|uniref:SdiA-regulated domain-containing protein n=1 Tax=Halopseudomonas sp. TaxID=2901191 RepID=UPI0030035816
MKKALIGLAVILLLGVATLRLLHLDSLLWHAWRLREQPLQSSSLRLGVYRVDIERRVIEGLEDDVSALTYNGESNTLFAVLNGEPLLVELSMEGKLLRRVRVNGVQDMEGLTHVSGNRYVVAEERSQRLLVIDVPEDALELDTGSAPSLTIGLDINGNKGFEGLSWDDRTRRLLVVKERDPLRVLAVTGFVDAAPGAPLAVHIRELKSPTSPRLFMHDLSSLSMHDETGHLLLLSDESHMVVEYDKAGVPLSLLGLWRGMAGLQRTIPQAEGLAMDEQNRLYLVSEPNLFYRFVPGE